MLVRVALDCDALKDTSTDQSDQEQKHQDLIGLLRQHGVIVLSADVEIKRTIANLSDVNVRKLWDVVAPSLYWELSDDPPAECLCRIWDCEQLRAVWAGKVDIAVANTARARNLGVPKDQPSRSDEQAKIEIVKFGRARSAEAFVRVEELSRRTLHEDETRETIWQERFEPLVMHSLHVTICDRYAGEILVRHYNNPRRESGLRWLLTRMSQSSKTYLHLILGAKATAPQNISSAVHKMVTDLPGPGIQDVKLTIVPDHPFGDIAHDRYIRFERNSVWIGRGLTIFEEPTQTQSSSYIYSLDIETCRSKEDKLKQAAYSDYKERIVKAAT